MTLARLLGILAFALAATALKAAHFAWKSSRSLEASSPTSLGMGEPMAREVVALEETLASRLEQEPVLGKDPLDLSRVAKVPQAARKEAEESEPMRLTMTLLSPGDSLAVLKFKGRSHTVRLGDTLGGWRMAAIDTRTVTMEGRTGSRVLVNRPAPVGEIKREAARQALEEIEL
jgi:hypothetical protein